MRQRLAVHVRLPCGPEHHLAADVPRLELIRRDVAIDAGECGLIVEARLRIVEVGDDRLIGDVAVRRLDPHRADQHQLAERRRRLACHLGRDPATEAQSHQRNIGQAEIGQQPAMHRGDVAHAAQPLRTFRLAPAGMVRHQNIEALRQRVVERQSLRRADVVMQDEHRPTAAAARQMHLAAGNIHRGLVPGHAGRHPIPLPALAGGAGYSPVAPLVQSPACAVKRPNMQEARRCRSGGKGCNCNGCEPRHRRRSGTRAGRSWRVGDAGSAQRRAGGSKRATDQRGRWQGRGDGMRRLRLRGMPAACGRDHASLRAAGRAGQQRRRHRADRHAWRRRSGGMGAQYRDQPDRCLLRYPCRVAGHAGAWPWRHRQRLVGCGAPAVGRLERLLHRQGGAGDVDPRDRSGASRRRAFAYSVSSQARRTPTCRCRSALPAST